MSAKLPFVFVAMAFTILASTRPARSQVPGGANPQPPPDNAYVPPGPATYGQMGVAPGAPQSYEQAGIPPSQVVQPTYSSPRPPAPAKPVDQHDGLFLMGNIGFHSYQGTTGTGLGAGLRLGGIAGWFITPEISLNGELSLDVLNFKSTTVAAQTNVTGVRVQISASPFYHLVLPIGAELLVGPKFGIWDTSLSDDASDYSLSEKGYLFGLNAGMYFHIGPLAAGGLLTIEDGVPTSSCVEYAGIEEYCGSVSSATSDKIVSLAGSVFF